MFEEKERSHAEMAKRLEESESNSALIVLMNTGKTLRRIEEIAYLSATQKAYITRRRSEERLVM